MRHGPKKKGKKTIVQKTGSGRDVKKKKRHKKQRARRKKKKGHKRKQTSLIKIAEEDGAAIGSESATDQNLDLSEFNVDVPRTSTMAILPVKEDDEEADEEDNADHAGETPVPVSRKRSFTKHNILDGIQGHDAMSLMASTGADEAPEPDAARPERRKSRTLSRKESIRAMQAADDINAPDASAQHGRDAAAASAREGSKRKLTRLESMKKVQRAAKRAVSVKSMSRLNSRRRSSTLKLEDLDAMRRARPACRSPARARWTVWTRSSGGARKTPWRRSRRNTTGEVRSNAPRRR